MEVEEFEKFKKALQEAYNHTPDHHLKERREKILVPSFFYEELKKQHPKLANYCEVTPKIKTNR